MRALLFVAQSVIAGLALAFLFFWVRPDLLPGDHQPVSYADAVTRAAPSVVNIYTTRAVDENRNPLLNDPLFRRFFDDREQPPGEQRQNSLGSGVIVSAAGYVLTNNHVIAGADVIHIMLQDGRQTVATLVGSDPETDLAILHIDLQDLPLLRVNEDNGYQVGDVVLAIGNPFGVGQTVTQGIISATGRNRLGINTFEDFIQTDAAINPGNSGGALINARGELIGINTAIYSPSGASSGIGFAITTRLALYVLDQIVRFGAVVRGWLGIEVRDLDENTAAALGMPGTRGVLVAGILLGGPAARAGLQPGDVLISINQRPVYTSEQAIATISSLPPGHSADVIFLRDGTPLRSGVEVSQRPNYKPRL